MRECLKWWAIIFGILACVLAACAIAGCGEQSTQSYSDVELMSPLVSDRALLTHGQKSEMLNKGSVTVDHYGRSYTFTPATLPKNYLWRE